MAEASEDSDMEVMVTESEDMVVMADLEDTEDTDTSVKLLYKV
jgi:hypothetical protein